MSPELQAIVEKARAEARERLSGYRGWLRVTTALVTSFPYLPDLLTGEARWLGRDAIQVGKNVIGVDGVVRA